ncbi:hypothetical protein B0T19DRAFT_25885 [Cercophora scortea]|uniref:Homeobox domain-containing protein n=1 Tax=Cercophora scortea TaxID=314031 RepID=A0AAE0MM12_9PEZI|nr:hypothetical protein B0T19DRAFT_25885 [Cercophora scortea]
MDMELIDVYRRPYPSLNMDVFHTQQLQHHQQQQQQQQQQHQHQQFLHQQQHQHPQQHHAQSQGHQYHMWNHQLIALYQQHQQRAAAAMMGQGNMHASKQTEPKPRLAKDEVELLEREFLKNPKPNSSTKRELAEQMGVEVPRINNWFQNRRAKEKQMRKTAEFEAQQAKERSSSESRSPEDQDHVVVSEFYGLSNHHQPLGLSTAVFEKGDGNADDEEEEEEEEDIDNDDDNEGEDEDKDKDNDNDDDDTQSQSQQGGFYEPIAANDAGRHPADATPDDSESDGFVHVEYDSSSSPVHTSQPGSELAPPAIISNSFAPTQHPGEFQRPQPYVFALPEHIAVDGLPSSSFQVPPSNSGMLRETDVFSPYPTRDYYMAARRPIFPSEMITEGDSENLDEELVVGRSRVKSEDMSPCSMPESPRAASGLRLRSPPPPADLAGRRNMRRPAPLGLVSLRTSSLGHGPKTGIDAPRRQDTVSPLRRISSATGSLCGRVQKSMMNSGGPRSPFALDRNKEALLQTLQNSHSPIMASLNSAMSPMSPEGMNGQGMRENTVATNASDEEQGYIFGSFNGVGGGMPMYKAEANIKTPPGTPGLPIQFQDPFFSSSVDQAWNFVPQDEPLPTPSLCSHGGSELEFSMAPHMPGYVASQPVTPSFPPSIGPTYNNFFGSNFASAEYNFPDSYPTESSARSSPIGPPRSKQFQFAQNVTPQDFHSEK